jgi:hypothetical protein
MPLTHPVCLAAPRFLAYTLLLADASELGTILGDESFPNILWAACLLASFLLFPIPVNMV